ncbi:hypothetical protein IFM12275_30690 [Nocardia sputorum]|nr:hypothetical protein IFM12275_30690 [Nocardia sputorum]
MLMESIRGGSFRNVLWGCNPTPRPAGFAPGPPPVVRLLPMGRLSLMAGLSQMPGLGLVVGFADGWGFRWRLGLSAVAGSSGCFGVTQSVRFSCRAGYNPRSAAKSLRTKFGRMSMSGGS